MGDVIAFAYVPTGDSMSMVCLSIGTIVVTPGVEKVGWVE